METLEELKVLRAALRHTLRGKNRRRDSIQYARNEIWEVIENFKHYYPWTYIKGNRLVVQIYERATGKAACPPLTFRIL